MFHRISSTPRRSLDLCNTGCLQAAVDCSIATVKRRLVPRRGRAQRYETGPDCSLAISHKMRCLPWLSAAASQGIHSFRLATRSQSDPPMVIGECLGCEFRNNFGSSDPSRSGDPEATLCMAVGQLRSGARQGPESHHRSKRGQRDGCAPEIPENNSSGLNRNTRTAHNKHAPQRTPARRPEGPISEKPRA